MNTPLARLAFNSHDLINHLFVNHFNPAFFRLVPCPPLHKPQLLSLTLPSFYDLDP